jgi:hypothetical protein
MNLTDELIDGNTLSGKLLLVTCGLSMSPSIIILPTDLLMAKARKKKINRFIPLVFSSMTITYQ